MLRLLGAGPVYGIYTLYCINILYTIYCIIYIYIGGSQADLSISYRESIFKVHLRVSRLYRDVKTKYDYAYKSS